MGVEILRRAAERIRVEQAREESLGHIDGRTYAAWLAMADWLESEAGAVEFDGGRPDLLSRQAVTAARVYLGEDE